MSSCQWPEHHKPAAKSGGGLLAVVAIVVVVYVVHRLAVDVVRFFEANAWLIAIPALAAAAAVAWIARGIVRAALRVARLGRAGRRNIPRVLLARFRWRQLARDLTLAYVERPSRRARLSRPGSTAVRIQASASGKPAKLRVPHARFRADEHGLAVIVRTIPDVGRKELERCAPYLADAWKVQRVAVSQPRPGRVVLRGLVNDPLLVPFGLEAAPPPGPGPLRIWLGRDEHGQDRWLDLANVSGVVVGGLPGSGKSQALTSWLTQFSGRDDVQLVTLDGKGSGEFADFAGRAWMTSGDSLDAAEATLSEVVDLMHARLACIREVKGAKNIWDVSVSADWPAVITILDEVQQFFDLSGALKADKPKVERCQALVAALVRKGRSCGFVTVSATQKPDSLSIPTFLRDNCGVRFAFALATNDAAVSCLGPDIRDYASYSPVALRDRAYAGCAIVTLPTGTDPFCRLRSPYVDADHAAKVAADTAWLRRDPRQLLADRPADVRDLPETAPAPQPAAT